MKAFIHVANTPAKNCKRLETNQTKCTQGNISKGKLKDTSSDSKTSFSPQSTQCVWCNQAADLSNRKAIEN